MAGFELNWQSKVKGSRLANCQNVYVNVAKYEIVKAIWKKCREATRESENAEVNNGP
jgi:hypothetical protein